MVAIFLILYDIVAIILSYFVALWIRFDCRFTQIPDEIYAAYSHGILIYGALCLVIFMNLRLYRSIWKFASYIELSRLMVATALSLVANILLMQLGFGGMPLSYYIFGIVIQFILTVGIRFSYRFVLLFRNQRPGDGQKPAENVMLIGAGQAGQAILRDIKRSRELNEKVCCIIDDDKNKWNRYIDGIKVVGGRESILVNCKAYKIDKIYYTIPSSDRKTEREVLNICNESHCKLKKLPGLYQLMNGEVSLADMKEVQIEDLLGRPTIQVNMEEIFQSIKGKVILVTGGGGSIGSELCRQIAAHEPKQLIIFDVYENNAYAIRLELCHRYPNLRLETLIGSVRDSRKMLEVMETYHPQIVYHAAAHKHVPLMEDSPCEAIKNNVLGTFHTALAAAACGCQRFVLISTDKAVNPTNIMGASKRLCEMVIQSFNSLIQQGQADKLLSLARQLTLVPDTGRPAECPERPGNLGERLRSARTEFVAVRFGNVLGSNGSVIPIFKQQIEEGGPVTVTHPDIIRYFMTIPEAVSLVLQAGVYAQGGEIFVFDMGDPIKIDTLARNLIRLSGHEPDVDIPVTYTGLRPGEKLYEEKLMAEEGLKQTDNKLIHIGCPIPFDTHRFLEQLQKLAQAAYRNDPEIRKLVQEMVVTYKPKEESK